MFLRWGRRMQILLWIGTLCSILTQQEIDSGYEYETGKVIIETFKERKLIPLAIPGVLLHGHGPFTWGKMRKVR